MANPSFPTFPESEHTERLSHAREKLEEAGFKGCICVSPENLFYLTGYDSIAYFNPQALVFSADRNDEPTLIVRNVDLSLVHETAWLEDVRTYHLHAADVTQIVAKVVREKNLGNGSIGIDLESYALPGGYALGLIRALDSANVKDATGLLNSLQHTKSGREMTYIREAAEYANIGLETARKTLKTGITEIELAAAIEGELRKAGSDYSAMPTMVASGPRTPGGHAAPFPRKIENGDLVHVEFAGVARRYHVIALHTMAVGDPGPRAKEIYDITLEALRAGIGVCEPGAPVAEMEKASLEPFRREGLEDDAMMRFGLGIGIGYPPIWAAYFQIDRYSKQRIKPGMVFYVHACLDLFKEKIGTVQGATYHVTPTGIERLSGGGDVELDIL